MIYISLKIVFYGTGLSKIKSFMTVCKYGVKICKNKSKKDRYELLLNTAAVQGGIMGLVKGEIVIRGLGCFTEQTRMYASYIYAGRNIAS